MTVQSRNGGTTVLLVDDQPIFRRATAALLRATGFAQLAGEATTGEEAVELAARIQPDLVLMDVRLPGIDGIEATRRILAAAPETRVLLVSTHEAHDLPSGLASCGAIGFVRKQDLSVDTMRAYAA